MSKAAERADAIRAIAKIITEQAVLERFQRSSGASSISISDGQVHAYDKIVRVMKPFMEMADGAGAFPSGNIGQ